MSFLVSVEGMTLILVLGRKDVRAAKVFMAAGPDAMTRDWPGRGQARWISKSMLDVCLLKITNVEVDLGYFLFNFSIINKFL
jgi:hypothetical protein